MLCTRKSTGVSALLLVFTVDALMPLTIIIKCDLPAFTDYVLPEEFKGVTNIAITIIGMWTIILL